MPSRPLLRRAWIKRELNGRCFAAVTTVVAHVTSFGGLYADWGKANTILLATALWPAVETGASPRWVSWRQDRPLSHLATIWQQDWQYQPNAAVMYVCKGGIVTALKRLALSVAPTCFQYHGIGRRTGLKIRSPQGGVGSSPTFDIQNKPVNSSTAAETFARSWKFALRSRSTGRGLSTQSPAHLIHKGVWVQVPPSVLNELRHSIRARFEARGEKRLGEASRQMDPRVCRIRPSNLGDGGRLALSRRVRVSNRCASSQAVQGTGGRVGFITKIRNNLKIGLTSWIA